MPSDSRAQRWLIVGIVIVGVTLLGGWRWAHTRYDSTPRQVVELTRFSNEAYPEDPEERSVVFGNYPHGSVLIERTEETRFRFRMEPASAHSAPIELIDVDLRHMVAAVPPWVKADADLTKVGLIDREWNRQQVRFDRGSGHVRIRGGGDGFEEQALSRVDLARNCLNAGLWELLLFTDEEGSPRVYEHIWFTFPLGVYKDLFETVNGLSYWTYWWSLEHWVDPSGTPIRLDPLRMVEHEWQVEAEARYDEAPQIRGEQLLKRRNIMSPPIHRYRDWYANPVQFASFIPPGRYSLSHPRDTALSMLAQFEGAVFRQVRLPEASQPLFELELQFRDAKTGRDSRIVIGGLDLSALPRLATQDYHHGWQVPFGIGNPGFFEPYEALIAEPPLQRPFYGFHLDAENRWIDHHAVGVDGPVLFWDRDDPTLLHVYLLSYERHAVLNHFVIGLPSPVLS